MLWNSDAPCAGREAASDVFLDGLNNECLKRLLGPQLPNLPPFFFPPRSPVLLVRSLRRRVRRRASPPPPKQPAASVAGCHWEWQKFTNTSHQDSDGRWAEEMCETWVRLLYITCIQEKKEKKKKLPLYHIFHHKDLLQTSFNTYQTLCFDQ